MTTLAQDLGGVVLLPCPFCGYDMTDEKDGVYQKAGFTGAQTPVWEVCCGATMCNASVTATSRELAIAAWNTRAHSAEIAWALRDADGWQPIESAPRDGTYILLGYEGSHSEEGRWMGDASRNHWGETGWFESDDDVLCEHPSKPTHWRPLPSPQTMESAMQQGGGGGE